MLWIAVLLCSPMLFACTAAQEKVVSPDSNLTPKLGPSLQPTSTPGMTPTVTSNASTTPTATARTNLFQQLSPGLYLAYAANEGSGFNSIPSIHVLSMDGQELGILAKNTSRKASLSPNGKRLAFIDFAPSGISELSLLDLETGQKQSFSVPGCSLPDESVGQSPDENFVAVSCGDRILIIDITGERAVVKTSLTIGKESGNEIMDPAWSPDGKWLSYYVANINDARDSSPHGPYLTEPKCPGDAAECQMALIKLSVEGLSLSKWTSDGLLAVAQENSISLFDPATQKKVNTILIPVTNPILSFAWSPDGQWIAYSVTSQTPEVLAEEIYAISPSGGDPILLSKKGDDVLFWLQIP